MSRRKDIQWAIWKSGTRFLDTMLWELGRIHGLREASGMTLARHTPLEYSEAVQDQMRRSADYIRAHARRLRKTVAYRSCKL